MVAEAAALEAAVSAAEGVALVEAVGLEAATSEGVAFPAAEIFPALLLRSAHRLTISTLQRSVSVLQRMLSARHAHFHQHPCNLPDCKASNRAAML